MSKAISIPCSLGFCDQLFEIRQRAELRVNRLMPALLGADGPGAADIVRRGAQRIVLAFAKRAPIG